MNDQIDLRTYLEQLEAQRATLNIRIAGAREALGLDPEEATMSLIGAPSSSAAPPLGVVPNRSARPGQIRPDEFFRMSIPESIRRYLEIMKAPQAITSIVGALKGGGVLTESKNFYTTVYTAIKRLRASGELVNTKTGWGLSEWYPNRPKSVDGKKAKPSKAAKAKSPQRKTPLGSGRQTGPGKQPDAYHRFLGEQIKAGKTMAEAIQAYREYKKAKG